MRTTNGVVVGASVSGLVAQGAGALPDGARVLAPEGEFSSVLFPFLAQAERGVEGRGGAAGPAGEAVDATTDVVAVSGRAVVDRRGRRRSTTSPRPRAPTAR